MNYLERYRSRVFRNTNNVRERERNDLVLEFEKHLKESLTSHEVTYSKVNEFPDLNANDKQGYLYTYSKITQSDDFQAFAATRRYKPQLLFGGGWYLWKSY